MGSRDRVEAEVVERVGTPARTAARVLDRRGVVSAVASATFTTLGEALVVRIAGERIDDRHHQYVND